MYLSPVELSAYFLKDYSYIQMVFYPAPEASGVTEVAGPKSNCEAGVVRTETTTKTSSISLNDDRIVVEFNDELSG